MGNGIKALVEPSDAWLEENRGEEVTPPFLPQIQTAVSYP